MTSHLNSAATAAAVAVALVCCGPSGKRHDTTQKPPPPAQEKENLGQGGGSAESYGRRTARKAAPPRTETSCDALENKNRQCLDAFVRISGRMAETKMRSHIRLMPPKDRAIAMARLRAIMAQLGARMKRALVGKAFMRECNKNWNKTTPKAQQDRAKITRCFLKPACEDYVRCLLSK